MTRVTVETGRKARRRAIDRRQLRNSPITETTTLTSRLLKKSFASTGKDGVVALSKDSSTSIVPSSSSSADPSPEISSQSGVDHPLPADQLAFYRDAHVDVASSLGARTRL